MGQAKARRVEMEAIGAMERDKTGNGVGIGDIGFQARFDTALAWAALLMDEGSPREARAKVWEAEREIPNVENGSERWWQALRAVDMAQGRNAAVIWLEAALESKNRNDAALRKEYKKKFGG